MKSSIIWYCKDYQVWKVCIAQAFTKFPFCHPKLRLVLHIWQVMWCKATPFWTAKRKKIDIFFDLIYYDHLLRIFFWPIIGSSMFNRMHFVNFWIFIGLHNMLIFAQMLFQVFKFCKLVILCIKYENPTSGGVHLTLNSSIFKFRLTGVLFTSLW